MEQIEKKEIQKGGKERVWKRQNPNPSIPILRCNVFPFFHDKTCKDSLQVHSVNDYQPILLLRAEIAVCSSLN